MTRSLLEGVKGRLGGRTPELITSDEYVTYPEVILSVFGEQGMRPVDHVAGY